MKIALLASIAALALASGSALAADMPVKAAPRIAPAPAYSWTGCYVDAGGGYGLWNQDHDLETIPALGAITSSTTNGGRGWLGRFGGGCDYQVGPILGGNLVVGVLADYDAMSIKGTNEPPDLLFGGISISGTEKESSAWYVGGRIGYAVTPAFLTYFDGGYTETRFGQSNLNSTLLPIGPTGLDIPSHVYHGWFLGGGTETSLAGLLPGLPAGLFLRSEYRYSTYQATDVPIVVTTTGIGTGFGEHIQSEVQTITTSLVWKFNWMAH